MEENRLHRAKEIRKENHLPQTDQLFVNYSHGLRMNNCIQDARGPQEPASLQLCFRPGYYEMQIQRLIKHIPDSLNRNIVTTLIFLDVAKTFQQVDLLG